MLLTPSPHDPKKSLLSILMTAYYESSPLAKDLYARLDAYLSQAPHRKDFHLTQALNKVTQFGPPRPEDAAMVPLKADKAYAGMSRDAQQNFFSNVVEFVRHLNYGHVSSGMSRAFRFAAVPDTEDTKFLKTYCRKYLPAIVNELRLESFQEWILRDYSPAKMMSNVIAIRPDVTIPTSAEAGAEAAANEGQRQLVDQLTSELPAETQPPASVVAALDAKIG